MCITLFLHHASRITHHAFSLQSLYNYDVERQGEKFYHLSQAKLKSGRLSSVPT